MNSGKKQLSVKFQRAFSFRFTIPKLVTPVIFTAHIIDPELVQRYLENNFVS